MKNLNCSFDKYPTPVFGDETTGTVFDAYVWEQNGRLRMDFSWRPRMALGVTFSDDGIHWEEPTVTLDLSEANAWENNLNRNCVIPDPKGDGYLMTETVTGDYPVGSTATILYIDEMDNVFIEWSDGKLSSFSDKQVLKGFEKTGA